MHEKLVVLIVEDDRDTRQLLALVFEHIGFTTYQAGDGNEALAVALAQHPDLITTDLGPSDGYWVELSSECALVQHRKPPSS
jgi:CheY-like chemotaxis protein